VIFCGGLYAALPDSPLTSTRDPIVVVSASNWAMTSPILPISGVQTDGRFSYPPLTEDNSIRLILIRPSPFGTANVHCNLVHTTLSQCEHEILDHYIALSYVWGDATNVRTIWVDDTQVNVTDNLYFALRDLRDATRVLRLWPVLSASARVTTKRKENRLR